MDDEEEDKGKKPSEPLPSVRKKVPLAQRLAEKEAEKERIRLEKAAQKNNHTTVEETEEEAFERRQRERQMQKDADLQNAMELFGDAASVTSSDATLDKMQPKTKEEFDQFAKLVVARIQSCQVTTRRFHYYASS